MAKPIVKWAGGKRRILGELLTRVPADVRTYVEPFAGGAALFFAVQAARSVKRAILADRNEELCACYRAVRDDAPAVIEALRAYKHDRELFYEVRAQETRGMDDAARAARLLFLNRTCFNGLWRVNASGMFNVPFGRYKNPRILNERALLDAQRALRDAKADVRAGDFAEVLCDTRQGDFVYLDPPYMPVSPTASFTSYASGGFGPEDQARLLTELHTLRARGVRAMLSNADTAETRALYADFAVHVVRAPRAISCQGGARGDVAELVVTSWDRPGVYVDAA